MSERLKDFDQAIDIMVHNYQWMIDSEKRSKTELHAKNYADYREFIVEAYKKALERVEELEKINYDLKSLYIHLEKTTERYKQALEFYADENNWITPSKDVVLMDGEPETVEGPPLAIEDSGENARQALGWEE